MSELRLTEDILDRMVRAVERVRERMQRAVAALEGAGIQYTVVGGHAVAAWVATVDEAAVRNTPDVDVLIGRGDFEAVKNAFADAGFIFRHDKGIEMFLDGPGAKDRDSIHVLFAGERVRAADAIPTPELSEAETIGTLRVVALEALVKMKLTSFRLKDRMHVRDMLDVGLVDAAWLPRLPEEPSARLKELLDSPEG
jgi:hypothetical protein